MRLKGQINQSKSESLSSHETRYDKYFFSVKDWMEYILRIVIKGVIIGYLFYDTWKMSFLLLPFAIADYFSLKRRKLKDQREELTLQFKSLAEAVATGLSAGYSLERAFKEAKKDLLLLYSEDAFIIQELNGMMMGMQMNIPIEKMLQGFGKRTGIDDIANFANVVAMAKKSGGNLVRIIQKTVNSISDKLAVDQEIATMIAAKQYEQRIMSFMPYVIIFYLRITDKGYFDVLYHNLLGITIMTVFLVVIHLADAWAQKIMEIRV